MPISGCIRYFWSSATTKHFRILGKGNCAQGWKYSQLFHEFIMHGSVVSYSSHSVAEFIAVVDFKNTNLNVFE